jgi:hypothetical protein
MNLLERRTQPTALPEDHDIVTDLREAGRRRQGVGV